MHGMSPERASIDHARFAAHLSFRRAANYNCQGEPPPMRAFSPPERYRDDGTSLSEI